MLYSQKCEYAVRALTHLAGRPAAELQQLPAIAVAEKIPAAFLSKILQDLSRAGLARSAKGPRGGYGLARSADSITLYDVKLAIDGPADLERCAVGLGRCSDVMPCPQHDTFKPLRDSIRKYLRETNLQKMARGLARKRELLRKTSEAASEASLRTRHAGAARVKPAAKGRGDARVRKRAARAAMQSTTTRSRSSNS